MVWKNWPDKTLTIKAYQKLYDRIQPLELDLWNRQAIKTKFRFRRRLIKLITPNKTNKKRDNTTNNIRNKKTITSRHYRH